MRSIPHFAPSRPSRSAALRDCTAPAWVVTFGLLLVACGGGGGRAIAISDDIDRDGIPNASDNDIDGDGFLNQFDSNVDGDLFPNWGDDDADDDGVPNDTDETPFGPWYPSPTTVFTTLGYATLNFGDVPVGQTAGPGDATIQNDTVYPLTLTRIALVGSAGGAFTLDTSGLPGGGAPFAFPAGTTKAFGVSYRPSRAGASLGRVEIDLRDSTRTFTCVVHLLGMASAPALTASGGGSTINFGDVPLGVTAGPAVAVVRNDGSAAYSVTRVELVGTGGGRFAIDLTDLPGGSAPFPLGIDSQASFRVLYTPNQGVPNVGLVEVGVDGPGGPRTLRLDLLGQGVAPAISIVPRPVDAGTALSGVEISRIPVEIRNEFFATGDLVVTAIAFPDDASGQYSIEANPAPFTLAPGAAPVSIMVRMTPAAGRFGPLVGRMRVQGNDPHGDVDQLIDLKGRGAGWTLPTTPLAADLTVAAGADSAGPVLLAGTHRAVLRSAGPNGVFGGVLAADDQIVVIDGDPDGDPTTNDARVIVRWSGFRLSSSPASIPVDAGDGLHVFFLEAGLDGTLGTADDALRVLDTVSGTSRTRACPSAGLRKSRPVIVDPASSRVVVAAGVGGILPSTDVMLVYENLLGDISAVGPSATVALNVVVPDLACCVPLPVSATAVVTLAADADGSVDSSDRRLDDGDEGLVQVRGLGSSPVVELLDLDRALTEAQTPTDGDAYCRPVLATAGSVLLATEGGSSASASDDDVARVDGVGTATLAVGARVVTGNLSGLASRPVALGNGKFACAAPGADGAYGTPDDQLIRLDPAGAMSVAAFGPGAALAGGGGRGSAPVVFGIGVLVPTAGPDGILGDADDRVLHLDPFASGAPSVLGVLPLPGGAITGSRLTETSAVGAIVLDGRFAMAADRGADGANATGDEVFRIFRDRDRDGELGTTSDDLDANGIYAASDSMKIAIGVADGDHTPVLPLGNGHFLTIGTGVNGVLGTGLDDAISLWWLMESVTLP